MRRRKNKRKEEEARALHFCLFLFCLQQNEFCLPERVVRPPFTSLKIERERERERERNEREGERRERRTREEEKDLCFFYTPTLSPRFFYFFSSTLPSTTIDSLLVTKARTSSSANFIVQCPLSDPFCPGGGNALPATRSPPKT